MDMKYGKKILATHQTYYDNNLIEVIICDSDDKFSDYYDIHVIHPSYKDNDLNTLELQEPKDCITLEEISNPIKMECFALEKALWHKFYGKDNKMHTFCVSFESEEV